MRAVALIVIVTEHQNSDSGEVDCGAMCSSGGGEDQATRHQIPARLQRAEWSGGW